MEYLSKELKMYQGEISTLGINDITRNRKEDNKNVYAHMDEEEMASYKWI